MTHARSSSDAMIEADGLCKYYGSFIATEEMADALIPRLETALTTAPGAVAGGSPPVLARRAAGILADLGSPWERDRRRQLVDHAGSLFDVSVRRCAVTQRLLDAPPEIHQCQLCLQRARSQHDGLVGALTGAPVDRQCIQRRHQPAHHQHEAGHAEPELIAQVARRIDVEPAGGGPESGGLIHATRT